MTEETLVSAERIHAAAMESVGAASTAQRLLLEDDPPAWADALRWLVARCERSVALTNVQVRRMRGQCRALARLDREWSESEREAYRLLREGIERLEDERLAMLDDRERYADRLRTLRGRCSA